MGHSIFQKNVCINHKFLFCMTILQYPVVDTNLKLSGVKYSMIIISSRCVVNVHARCRCDTYTTFTRRRSRHSFHLQSGTVKREKTFQYMGSTLTDDREMNAL